MVDVYLIYQNRLFGDAIRAILATRPDITLLGMSDRPEVAEAEINAFEPSVILLEEADDHRSTAGVHSILTGKGMVRRLITLRPGRDSMRIWSGVSQAQADAQDLVTAIITAGEGVP